LELFPEPVKKPINNAWKNFKKIFMSLCPKKLSPSGEESKKSALKGFATQHTIKAPKNQTFDPKMFLVAVKQKALEKFKPQTKVRIVPRTRMEYAVLVAGDKTIVAVSTAGGKTIVEVRNVQSKT